MTVGQLILAVIVIGVVVLAIRQRPAGAPLTAHGVLKVLLALWAVGYLVVSCSPMVAGTSSAGAAGATGIASLIIGAALFGPWIVGIIVLGVLVLVTK